MITLENYIWSFTINTKTELVIFDLDGTLCDSFNDIYLSLKHTLDIYNVFTPSLPEVQSFIGDGLLKLIERTLNVSNQIHLLDDIMKSFMDYYKIHCTDSTLLFPGMDNVIISLYNQNIKMAVVSNKAENLVKIIINHLNLSKYFQYVFGGDSFSEKKPSPLPLNYILENLKINPQNSIIVGDSDNDVIAGSNALMRTCFCTFGYSALYKSSSDYTINSPIELLNIIKG